MRFSLLLAIVLPLPVIGVPAQSSADQPVSIVESSWRLERKAATNQPSQSITPQKEITASDKYWARKARENQVAGGAPDPSETTLDGRRAALDKAVEESRVPKPKDVDGYLYRAVIRNNNPSAINVIYWEYRFVEKANPSNIARRQFLCAANIKRSSEKELSLFSTLGPMDVISAETAASFKTLFREEALINRVEFADDSIIQRSDWKFADVKKSVERATATPWGREVCRSL